MKGQRLLPYFFLLSLAIIAIFILGVNYGKRVEQVNENITFLMTIAPTKVDEQIVTPSLKYLTYSSKECGVQFLYPSTLTTEGDSSRSATLVQNEEKLLQFSCEKNADIAEILNDQSIATEEVTFKNRKLKGKKQGTIVYFQVRHPNRGTSLYLGVESNLLPLVENTLQYTP